MDEDARALGHRHLLVCQLLVLYLMICLCLRPRGEDGGPGALGPARVGDVPVDVVGGEVEPVLPRHREPARVLHGLGHHLGRAGGAGGEEDLHQVGVLADPRLQRIGEVRVLSLLGCYSAHKFSHYP